MRHVVIKESLIGIWSSVIGTGILFGESKFIPGTLEIKRWPRHLSAREAKELLVSLGAKVELREPSFY